MVQAWKGQIARGSTPLFLGNLFALGLSFAKSIVLARGLGPEMFGLLTYALALTTFAAQFISLRTGETIVRFVGGALAHEESSKSMAFFQVGLALDAVTAAATLLLIRFVVLPGIGAHPQRDVLQPLVSIYALAVPFILLQATFNSLIITLKRFKIAAFLRVAASSLEVAAVLLGLSRGVNFVMRNMVIAAVASFTLLAVWGSWLFWSRTKTWHGEGYRAAWKEMQPFTVSGGLLGSLKALTTNLDVVVLGVLRPASEVGFYSLARSVVGVLATIVAPLLQAVHPLMNEAWVLKEWTRLRRLIVHFMLINGAIVLSAIVFLLFRANWLVEVFYGSSFTQAADLIRVLILSVGVQAVFGWMRKLVLISGHPGLDLAAGVIGTGSFVLLLVPFISVWGAIGLAVLFLLNAIMMVALFTWFNAVRLPSLSAPTREPGRAG